MSRFEDRLIAAVGAAGPKPPDSVAQSTKRVWSQKLSDCLALAIAAEARDRGMKGAMPAGPGDLGGSGAERRLSGGIGAKKVDVSWSTEQSGLVFAVSIKTIMFRDKRSGAFQKNLTNRRGDMLFEVVTLHRRFPYSVMGAFMFLDIGAASDNVRDDGGVKRRQTTFHNAFKRLRLFTGREEPTGREEQFEKFYILLLDVDPHHPSIRAFEAHEPDTEVPLDTALEDLINLVGERNFDVYEAVNGQVRKLPGA